MMGGPGAAMGGDPGLLQIMAGVVGLSLITFAVVTMTSFVKLSTVLFLVRNALGTQQTPPNMVMYGIALMLTMYIMAPVVTESYGMAVAGNQHYQTVSDYQALVSKSSIPVKTFLVRFTSPGEREFFANAAHRVWGEDSKMEAHPDDMIVVVPAFMLSELRRGFEAGFLLYLPFIAIDLVVSTVLMAMGMSAISPTTISVPFKLFLFVAVEGWTRLFHGLVLGYAIQ